jgi:hypothetical protein
MSKFRIIGLRDIINLVKELDRGLRDINFIDNFDSFETTVTIPLSSELAIRNELTIIPTRYIIVSQTGNGLVTRGTSTDTKDFIYLHNNGTVAVTIKVIFFR